MCSQKGLDYNENCVCPVDLIQERSGKFKYIVLLGRAAVIKKQEGERDSLGAGAAGRVLPLLPSPMFLSPLTPSPSLSLLVTRMAAGWVAAACSLTAHLYCSCLRADEELQPLPWASSSCTVPLVGCRHCSACSRGSGWGCRPLGRVVAAITCSCRCQGLCGL